VRLLSSPVANSVGVNPVTLRVPVVARGFSYAAGQIVELDFIGQTPGSDAKLGSPASVFSQIRPTTALGARCGRVHGVTTEAIRQNRVGYVVVMGIVDIAVENASEGLRGVPLVIDTNNENHHGKRIKGIALSSRTGFVTALWNGYRGFGHVYTPPSGSASGGGSLPSDPSGGSSGNPSGESSGGAHEGGEGEVIADD
jgi:hypothetical protein